MESERFFDCVAHHSSEEISKDDLISSVLQCKNGGPAVVNTQAFVDKLIEEGVVEQHLIPNNENVFYQLSPIGKKVLQRIITEGDKKYQHPKIELDVEN